MVTKLKKSTESTPKAAASTSGTQSRAKSGKAKPDKVKVPLTSAIKDSAQQIWQAGLGAFLKAQVEGTKAFEALVKEGVSFQRRTQSAAEEKITEATQRVTSMASDISSKASGQWDKLESIFEERVARALNKLGVPSAKDINALIARIDALNASVQALTPARTKAAKPSTAAKDDAVRAEAEAVDATKTEAAVAAPKRRSAKKSVDATEAPAAKPSRRKSAVATQPAPDQVNPE
ncbi:MAG: phasin family protein [Rhodoferax sp.]